MQAEPREIPQQTKPAIQKTTGSPGSCTGTVPEEMGYPSYNAFLGAKSSSHKCGSGHCTICNWAAELQSPSHHHLWRELSWAAERSASMKRLEMAEQKVLQRLRALLCNLLPWLSLELPNSRRGAHMLLVQVSTIPSHKLKSKSSFEQL